MTRKLLHKTSVTYLIFSIITLLITAPLFFFITNSLYLEETDETLILHKTEFVTNFLPSLTISEIPIWNKYNRDVKIESTGKTFKDTIFNTFYYDTLDAELEPYRELNTTILIEGRPFCYVAKINLIEARDLIEHLALIFILIIFMLLVGLLLITKFTSAKLWKPFNETLLKIESFEIDNRTPPLFQKSDIEEFNRLNESIEKLIKRNTYIFKNQREFIENAAHELQTPLAVFSSKIDTLLQSLNINKEQSEIINSLYDSISRLNRLNKNLLLLSKLENHNYDRIEKVSLKEVVEKQLEFFTEQAKSKNLTICLLCETPVHLETNLSLFEILVSNLLLNAIRHNVQNGQVTISITNHSFLIINSGIQKSLDTEKVFNRFSKSDSSSQGTGLGLAIVKKITELNAWSVEYSYENDLHSFLICF